MEIRLVFSAGLLLPLYGFGRITLPKVQNGRITLPTVQNDISIRSAVETRMLQGSPRHLDSRKMVQMSQVFEK